MAAALHCYRFAAPLKQAAGLATRLQTAEGALTAARVDYAGMARAFDEQRARGETLEARLGELQARIGAFQCLPTLRLRDAALKVPVFGSVLRAGARRLARWLGPEER